MLPCCALRRKWIRHCVAAVMLALVVVPCLADTACSGIAQPAVGCVGCHAGSANADVCAQAAQLCHTGLTPPCSQIVAMLPRIDRSFASVSRNLASYDLYVCDEATRQCTIASTSLGGSKDSSSDLQNYADVREW